VLGFAAGIRDIPPAQWRGELGYLAAVSPAVRRLALDMTSRQAATIAAAISDTSAVSPEVARLEGIALADVFQLISSDSGRRTLGGQSQEARPICRRKAASQKAEITFRRSPSHLVVWPSGCFIPAELCDVPTQDPTVTARSWARLSSTTVESSRPRSPFAHSSIATRSTVVPASLASVACGSVTPRWRSASAIAAA
jgi:hypothetical protein